MLMWFSKVLLIFQFIRMTFDLAFSSGGTNDFIIAACSSVIYIDLFPEWFMRMIQVVAFFCRWNSVMDSSWLSHTFVNEPYFS